MSGLVLLTSTHSWILSQALAHSQAPSGRQFSYHSLADPQLRRQSLQAMQEAEAIFIYSSSEPYWDEFVEPARQLGQLKPVVWLAYETERWSNSSVSPQVLARANEYLSQGGPENALNLLRYLHALSQGTEAEISPPLPLPQHGLWHPAAPQDFYAEVEDYERWYESYSQGRLKRGRLALLINRHFWANEKKELESALIEALEKQGLETACVFCAWREGADKAFSPWLTKTLRAGQPDRLHGLIKLTHLLAGEGGPTEQRAAFVGDDSPARSSVRLLRTLNVPVFQPIFSHGRSIQQWLQDPQGLGSDLTWSVTLPEFEGVIAPHYIGGLEQNSPGDPAPLRRPHLERVAHLAARVGRWVDLSRKPVAQRKVAFVLQNSPCASVEATVGTAANLDALNSVAFILKRLKAAGYDVEPPADGQALIDEIIARKALSEFRWTTVEEIVGKGGALACLDSQVYEKWFNQYPAGLRQRLIDSWGAPPGCQLDGVPAAMVHEGRLVISGLRLGPGAVVCVQPKRGCAGSRCDGRVCRILHDPDLPPPHQYLATYRWLQEPEGFGADLLVHVGTEGSLEYLPGKPVALSAECLPDLALHHIPHVYIYSSDCTAAGLTAKRRSYAVLVDHQQAIGSSAGLYGELDQMRELLSQWRRAADNPGRRAQLQELIKKEAQEGSWGAEFKKWSGSFEDMAVKLGEELALAAGSQIAASLHVFGQKPQGEQKAQLIYGVLRFESPGEPSLRALLAKAYGLDLAQLLREPGLFYPQAGLSGQELLQKIEDQGLEICRQLLKGQDFRQVFLRLTALDSCPESPLFDSLPRRLEDIDRRLEASDELGALLSAFDGGYITPGPSALISRGREDVLPTGRNFYTQDPRRLPTAAACLLGWDMAEALLDKYLREEGRYPENVAFFWMSSDMLHSDGEMLAQMMALLGVRIRWKANGVVDGFEIIELKRLGRPRIDLTVRLSAVLRDSFGGAVELLDEAISAVAALDEPLEENYVRRHSLERLQEAAGGDSPEAWRRATFRIFAPQPGAQHGGVYLAVMASAWRNQTDLSQIFIHGNSYAYGRGVFGQACPDMLESSLSSVDLAYNKVTSENHDLLTAGYFSVQGGLAAAAAPFQGGRRVRSYVGDSRESTATAVRGLDDELRRLARSKLLNPAWIEGMKASGYRGAMEISSRVGNIYGWQSTTGEVEGDIFDDIASTFVLNEENRAFFEKHNPWALEEIGRRLLEAESRGLWQASPEMLSKLKMAYLGLEGVLEEHTEAYGGELQGGSVDILSAADLDKWREKMENFRAAFPPSSRSGS